MYGKNKPLNNIEIYKSCINIFHKKIKEYTVNYVRKIKMLTFHII